MNQPMFLKFKNYLHITTLHMIAFYYWATLICHFLINTKDLCDMFELNHLIKDSTCFKSSNSSCIDNFNTNKNKIFFNSSTVETGISDHYSLICNMLRSTFCKGPSKFIYCRSYNNYNKEQFENVLKQRLVS